MVELPKNPYKFYTPESAAAACGVASSVIAAAITNLELVPAVEVSTGIQRINGIDLQSWANSKGL